MIKILSTLRNIGVFFNLVKDTWQPVTNITRNGKKLETFPEENTGISPIHHSFPTWYLKALQCEKKLKLIHWLERNYQVTNMTSFI